MRKKPAADKPAADKPAAAWFPGNLRNPCENGHFLMPVETHRLSGKMEILHGPLENLGKTAISLTSFRLCKIRTVSAAWFTGNPYKTLQKQRFPEPCQEKIPFLSRRGTNPVLGLG